MFYKNNPSSLRKEILSGFTVAIVQVPESIAFSFVTGVPPLFGLYATVFLAFITAAIGGGPGMISGAQGAIAVVMADLVSDSGPLSDLGRASRIEHLLLAVFFIGLFQVVFGILGLAKLAKLIPETAMLGFVDGLAIIILISQLGAFKFCDSTVVYSHFEECPHEDQKFLPFTSGVLWMVFVIVLITIGICHYWPKLPKVGKLIP
eukprot:76223_1